MLPNIKITSTDNLTLLGSPILEGSIDSCLQSKLSDLKRLTERLLSLDSHDALFLLKNCLALPKLTYILRSSPCYKSSVLQEFDKLIIESLEKVLYIKIDEKTWKQCKLPVRYGGLGVRSTVDVSLPAFLSSTFASQKVSNSILPDDLKDKAYEDQEAAVISYSNKEGISQSNIHYCKAYPT